ncbi:MAG: family 16 glycoside hydrolase [Anaerolineaceae bacterium]
MKRFSFLLIAVLLLSACNIPSSATSTPDLVATNVAMALTNAPANTAVLETEPVAVTATDLPTAMPSSAPTETSTPTAEPTATSTSSPEDPAVRYGNPTSVEEFNSSTGTWNYEDDWFSLNVSDGQLHIYSKGTPYWNSWYTIGPAIQNFYLETTLTMPNCSGKDRVGLAFRLTNDNQYYFMGLTCDGTWGFNRFTSSNESQTILNYQKADQLKATNEANRVGVLANGDKFEFYINGVKVGETTDSTYPAAGTYGFVSMSAGTLNFKTNVDKLTYWVLP